MTRRSARSILVAVAAATTLLTSGFPVGAATAPTRARIVAHFDFAAGQTAENLALEPDGSVDVSFVLANQVVRVARDGTMRPLAQLPSGGRCGMFPVPTATGIARARDGALYVAECSGDANTGVWRVRPGSAPEQIAALPVDGLPNGMAIDDRTGDLYVADSVRAEVWRVPTRGGAPAVWAAGPTLVGTAQDRVGANGIEVHGDAVWVGNTDQGLIVRIPIRPDGTAGPFRTVVTGLDGELDDFTVVGHDTVVAALIHASQVVEVRPGGQRRVLLTAENGLSNPTSVAARGDDIYVTSGAYFTMTDPNLLVAHLRR